VTSTTMTMTATYTTVYNTASYTETAPRETQSRLNPDSLIPDFVVPVITGAPCSGLIDVFFPSPSLKAAERNALVERAKAICAGCVHIDACFAGAVERVEVDGVWGGELFRDGAPVPAYIGPGRPRKIRTCASVSV
jgi:WhiB family transcriptional regulator, redox-sensing transcriptional regulator